MKPVVQFSNLEIWALQELAKQRWQIKGNWETDDKKIDAEHSSFHVNFVGIKGEYAVAKHLGLNFDLAVQDGPDAGFDLVSTTGRTVQVKYTRYTSGALSFNHPTEFTADVAVLVSPVEKGNDLPGIPFQLDGWITQEAYANEHSIGNWGYGDRYIVWSKDMRQFP